MSELSLFDNDKAWKDEWEGMPEFVQEDLTSFNSVIVHFRNQEDMDKFAELIGQKIKKNGMKASVWFPKAEPRQYANKRYIDES